MGDLRPHPPSHCCNQEGGGGGGGGEFPPSVLDGEGYQVTPKETRHAPKMAAWCEGEHPPQSKRTMEPSVSSVRAALGVSLFNQFSGMGGKRSKVTETDLWKEGEEEEEGPEAEPWDGDNPLVSGAKYDPVMTKDGFIRAREQPKT